MFSNQVIISLVILSFFILVHVFGENLKFLEVIPRSKWLSMASGVSIAYVFFHLLPDLANILEEHTNFAKVFENFTYAVAFLGLLTFYGAEKISRKKALKGGNTLNPEEKKPEIFWIHLITFALYNFIIAYLLLHHISTGIKATLAYGIALSLHLLVNDKEQRDSFGRLYLQYGRWILCFALVIGWIIGIYVFVSKLWIDILMAFIAGGIILNTFRGELPAYRESNYGAFVFGGVGYGVLAYLFL